MVPVKVKTFLGNVRQLIISLYLATIRFLINYEWKFPSQLAEHVIKKSTEFRSIFCYIQEKAPTRHALLALSPS